jgi:hypothetical protein
MYEVIGTHDLRLEEVQRGGFVHLALRDADAGDVIVVNEDDIRSLRDRLTETIDRHSL